MPQRRYGLGIAVATGTGIDSGAVLRTGCLDCHPAAVEMAVRLLIIPAVVAFWFLGDALDAAMNALFGYYHEMAVSASIDTDWHIELPEPLPVTELDMVSMLGNLMENAIDGCRTMPEGKRYFCLTTQVQHGNSLYIVSTNSFDGKTRKGKDGYRSTKHSGKGTGLASIAAAAEKYGGSVQVSDNGAEFYVDIMLYLPLCVLKWQEYDAIIKTPRMKYAK